MSSLAKLLPKPTRSSKPPQPHSSTNQPHVESLPSTNTKGRIPPYGKRKGWVPKTAADFMDGGAYPEIPVAQYPLGMGRKKKAATGGGGGGTVQISLDGEGKVQYDTLVKQGLGKGKVVHSTFKSLLPKDIAGEEEDPSLHRPDEEDVQATLESTRSALEKIVNTKISAAQATANNPALQIAKQNNNKAAQYIRYTPADQNSAHNSGASQRIIKLVEMPTDPMEPPKFKHKLAPRGPPSPPAPVMHSPPRKLTQEDHKNWKIPPSISQYKNPRGYTVALDKRLAAEGRDLEEHTVSDKFSKFAEALHIADRKAREAVELRGQVQRKMAQKEKEKKEESLRNLAQRARDERAGIRGGADRRDRDRGASGSDDDYSGEDGGGDGEERLQREEARRERRRERERMRRTQRAGAGGSGDMRERDIGEKVALGAAFKPQGDSMYDQRLFNQSEGMSSGYGGDDDTMGVYSKPLFSSNAAATASAIYRPSKDLDNEVYGSDDELEKLKTTKRFTADKGFSGGVGGGASQPRDGPVQFEKEAASVGGKKEDSADIFGLDQFLSEAKKGGSGKKALDHIGQRGALHAGSSGGSRFNSDEPGQMRKKAMEFESSGYQHGDREVKKQRRS
eukprot:Nk52_evm10s2542 gene=Nk52_evmTU10s2542